MKQSEREREGGGRRGRKVGEAAGGRARGALSFSNTRLRDDMNAKVNTRGEGGRLDRTTTKKNRQNHSKNKTMGKMRKK